MFNKRLANFKENKKTKSNETCLQNKIAIENY